MVCLGGYGTHWVPSLQPRRALRDALGHGPVPQLRHPQPLQPRGRPLGRQPDDVPRSRSTRGRSATSAPRSGRIEPERRPSRADPPPARRPSRPSSAGDPSTGDRRPTGSTPISRVRRRCAAPRPPRDRPTGRRRRSIILDIERRHRRADASRMRRSSSTTSPDGRGRATRTADGRADPDVPRRRPDAGRARPATGPADDADAADHRRRRPLQPAPPDPLVAAGAAGGGPGPGRRRGALGNEVLKNLALLGVGTVYVIDLDDGRAVEPVAVGPVPRRGRRPAQGRGRRRRAREINPEVAIVADPRRRDHRPGPRPVRRRRRRDRLPRQPRGPALGQPPVLEGRHALGRRRHPGDPGGRQGLRPARLGLLRVRDDRAATISS